MGNLEEWLGIIHQTTINIVFLLIYNKRKQEIALNIYSNGNFARVCKITLS